MDYDVVIRKDPSATGFRNLTDVTWDRNSSNASRKFSFNLTAAATSIKELQYYSQIQRTTTAKLSHPVILIAKAGSCDKIIQKGTCAR